MRKTFTENFNLENFNDSRVNLQRFYSAIEIECFITPAHKDFKKKTETIWKNTESPFKFDNKMYTIIEQTGVSIECNSNIYWVAQNKQMSIDEKVLIGNDEGTIYFLKLGKINLTFR